MDTPLHTHTHTSFIPENDEHEEEEEEAKMNKTFLITQNFIDSKYESFIQTADTLEVSQCSAYFGFLLFLSTTKNRVVLYSCCHGRFLLLIGQKGCKG